MNPTSDLQSEQVWLPTQGDIQRGRALLLKELNSANNLVVHVFARRARKSRAQVMRDVRAKRYLALRFGGRKIRLPAFQLEHAAQQLVISLVHTAHDVDEWTIYGVLTQQQEALNGKTAVECVNRKNIRRIVNLLLAQLGVHS